MRSSSPYLLAGLLAGAAMTHFTHPGFYDQIVPRALPGPSRAWTWGSGVAELAVAGAVALPRSRRRGAMAAAVLFVVVFPANVQMALDVETTRDRFLAYGRLPLQLPLVVWAWRVSRASAR
ncbi:MAG TPA: MauE/DoxX family redox-associated membrane protein [Mycobacteriales bacterium]|nr:MauE/DoxX family redox-associated membrane protein [Mycobacteriales bacterium]